MLKKRAFWRGGKKNWQNSYASVVQSMAMSNSWVENICLDYIVMDAGGKYYVKERVRGRMGPSMLFHLPTALDSWPYPDAAIPY